MRFPKEKFNNPFICQFLCWAVFAVSIWYVILCAAHLFSGRPLWNDEECVFRSIQTFGAYQMFHEPLRSLQVFPRVYLFLIQAFSRLFDFSLVSLRFFSFIAMLAAFFVWQKIARRELAGKLSYLTFVVSWCASAVLIYYSAELK